MSTLRLSARKDSSYYAARGHRPASQGVTIVPGHPLRWLLFEFLGVAMLAA